MPENIEILSSAPAKAEGHGCGCGGHDDVAAPARAHSCGCGGHDEVDAPVLDVRAIPHAIRHATVFGAFDAIAPGASLVIVAPHMPKPMLAQLAERAPIEFVVLVDGPEEWHVRITRLAA